MQNEEKQGHQKQNKQYSSGRSSRKIVKTCVCLFDAIDCKFDLHRFPNVFTGRYLLKENLPVPHQMRTCLHIPFNYSWLTEQILPLPLQDIPSLEGGEPPTTGLERLPERA